MRLLTTYLATALMFLLVGQDTFAVKAIKCGDLTGVEVEITMPGTTVPATDSAGAMAQYGQRLANKADTLNKIRCKIEECDGDAIKEQSCKAKLLSFSGTPPTPTPNDDSTQWSFPPATVKFKVSCSNCVYPVVEVYAALDPADGTLALCDGAMNMVELDMAGITIFDAYGFPVTMQEAQERWLNIIVQDNGNYIPGSEPWGCMLSECTSQGFESGCNMTIHEGESQPVPIPDPDPETGGWSFAPTTYMMAYSCSPCGEEDATQERKANPVTYGIERVKDSDLIENLFPNPSTEHLNMVLNLEGQGAEITVMDMSGKMLKSFKVSVSSANKGLISIDVSDLASGMYQLNVVTSDNISSRKFSVNR